MPLDLRDDHLAIIKNILKARVPEREVLAFGSRVTGRARPTSDLDLAVLGEEPLSFERIAHLKDDFSESNLPFKVDVIDWARVSDAFREVIRQEHEVLQAAGPG
jgi:predicted nucleotidyltransferase